MLQPTPDELCTKAELIGVSFGRQRGRAPELECH